MSLVFYYFYVTHCLPFSRSFGVLRSQMFWTAIRSVSIQFEPSSQRFYYLFHVHSGLRCDVIFQYKVTHTQQPIENIKSEIGFYFSYACSTGPFVPIKTSASINTFICKTYKCLCVSVSWMLVLIYGRIGVIWNWRNKSTVVVRRLCERRHEEKIRHPKFNRMNSNWREMLDVFMPFYVLFSLTFKLGARKTFCCSFGCGCSYELRLLPFSFHFFHITFSSSLSPSFSTCC